MYRLVIAAHIQTVIVFVNIINSSPYWHVNGVVEAGVFISQLEGCGMIPSFLVGLTEETSMHLSHRIHVEHVRDV